MRWTKLVFLTMLSASIAPIAAAQDSDTYDSPWRTSWFPFVAGYANDGPLLGVRVHRWQPAPYEARTTFTGAINVDAGATPNGTRYARAEFDAPLLWKRWRFKTSALAAQEARFGYFGVGNETGYDGDLVTEAQPFLYRVKRTRYRAFVEASRYLRPPFLVSFAGEFGSSHFRALPGPSTFATDFGSELKEDDFSGRIAFIYDTRNVEYNAQRGLLLETGVQAGTGGGNYTRLYAVLRGYLPLREGTVIAARLAGSGMGGDPTLDARFTIPTWGRPISVLGGEYSHRALDTGRLAGRHVLLGNLELRQDLLNFGDLGAITILVFTDAGRVFETESFALTTDGLKVGGGGGIALRLLRSTIFTFNFATGPDGFNFSIGSGWMF